MCYLDVVNISVSLYTLWIVRPLVISLCTFCITCSVVIILVTSLLCTSVYVTV